MQKGIRILFEVKNLKVSQNEKTWKDPDKFIVPRDPGFCLTSLLSRPSEDNPLRWAKKYVGTFMSGRYAIYHGARALGLGEGVEVLVPEFHCHTIVEALIAAGASVAFFKIKESGEIDLADVERRLTERTRGLLIIHYFGFPQDIPRIRDWCNDRHLFLVEDCAHSLFGNIENRPLGSWGEVAIFSVCKTLPTIDGGIMLANSPEIESGFYVRPQGLLAVTKGFFKSLMLMRIPDSLRLGLLKWVKTVRDRLFENSVNNKEALQTHGSFTQRFVLEESGIDMHPISKWILNHANSEKIMKNRRMNYQYLAKALQGRKLFSPQFPDLPAGGCPYVFPVRVSKEVKRVHRELVRMGIPVLVFPDQLHPTLSPEEFPYAYELANSLLCLPCHHELTFNDIEKMVSVLLKVEKHLN